MAVAAQHEAGGTTPAGTRSGGRLESLAPLTGVVAVVLLIIAAIVFESGDAPDEAAAPAAYLDYFDDQTDSIIGGSLLFAFGLLFLLWFAGSLRAALARAEGESHRLSSLVLAGATGMVVCVLAALAPHVSGAIAAFLSIRREFIGRPDEVKRIFCESATSLGRERYFEGHGLVDLMRAIQSI